MINSAWGGQYVILLGMLAVLNGCDLNDQPKKEVVRAVEKPKGTRPLTAARLRQVNVLVDLSGGMAGFVHPNAPGEPGSDFQQTVTNLLSDVQAQTGQGIKPAYYFVELATSPSKSVLRPTTYQEVSRVISKGAKKYALGTEMPEMLRQAMELQTRKPGTVNIIVSDFIYGPEDQQQVWRVRTDVKDALALASSAGQSVSVYAGKSGFRGTFYPGTRHRDQPLHGEAVPYYIWVTGPALLVEQVNKRLMTALATSPQVHFNRATLAPEFDILTGYEALGSWFVDPTPAPASSKSVVFSELSVETPGQFVVGLDLRALPIAAQQQFTASALELDPASTDAKLIDTWTTADPKSSKLSAKVKGKYTHFVQIALTKIRGAQQAATLTLRLPSSGAALPGWVADYSTTTDDNIAKQGAKTFRLTDVLQGVSDAFSKLPSAAAPVWQVPITVRLDD